MDEDTYLTFLQEVQETDHPRRREYHAQISGRSSLPDAMHGYLKVIGKKSDFYVEKVCACIKIMKGAEFDEDHL